MDNLIGHVVVFICSVGLCAWSRYRDRKLMGQFACSAHNMRVVFRGKKYKCIRDNGRMLKLEGVRDMVYKGYCRPL